MLRTLYNSLLAADLQVTNTLLWLYAPCTDRGATDLARVPCLQIDELLAYFDTDGDGVVTFAEATEALARAELGLSAAQVGH